MKIGRSVAGELIYNVVEIDCVFIERFMRYVCFCGDNFFLVCTYPVWKRC